jgi:Tol biopolymer transport system component
LHGSDAQRCRSHRRIFFAKNLTSGALDLVSQDPSGARGNGTSTAPAISENGRYVAFLSTASNLVTGDTNGFSDVFVRDLTASTTTRVSVDSSGAQSNAPTLGKPSISDDGRYVAFVSDASNLAAGDTPDYPDAYLHDRMTGTTRKLSRSGGGAHADRATLSAVVSRDGRKVAFDTNATNLVAGDTLGFSDVFVLDNCAP